MASTSDDVFVNYVKFLQNYLTRIGQESVTDEVSFSSANSVDQEAEKPVEEFNYELLTFEQQQQKLNELKERKRKLEELFERKRKLLERKRNEQNKVYKEIGLLNQIKSKWTAIEIREYICLELYRLLLPNIVSFEHLQYPMQYIYQNESESEFYQAKFNFLVSFTGYQGEPILIAKLQPLEILERIKWPGIVNVSNEDRAKLLLFLPSHRMAIFGNSKILCAFIKSIYDKLNAISDEKEKNEYALSEIDNLSNEVSMVVLELKFNVLLRGMGYKGSYWEIANKEKWEKFIKHIFFELRLYVNRYADFPDFKDAKKLCELIPVGINLQLNVDRLYNFFQPEHEIEKLPGTQLLKVMYDNLLKKDDENGLGNGVSFAYQSPKGKVLCEMKFNFCLRKLGYLGRPWEIKDLTPDQIMKKVYDEVILSLQQVDETLRVLSDVLKQPTEPYKTLLYQYVVGVKEPEITQAEHHSRNRPEC